MRDSGGSAGSWARLAGARLGPVQVEARLGGVQQRAEHGVAAHAQGRLAVHRHHPAEAVGRAGVEDLHVGLQGELPAGAALHGEQHVLGGLGHRQVDGARWAGCRRTHRRPGGTGRGRPPASGRRGAQADRSGPASRSRRVVLMGMRSCEQGPRQRAIPRRSPAAATGRPDRRADVIRRPPDRSVDPVARSPGAPASRLGAGEVPGPAARGGVAAGAADQPAVLQHPAGGVQPLPAPVADTRRRSPGASLCISVQPTSSVQPGSANSSFTITVPAGSGNGPARHSGCASAGSAWMTMRAGRGRCWRGSRAPPGCSGGSRRAAAKRRRPGSVGPLLGAGGHAQDHGGEHRPRRISRIIRSAIDHPDPVVQGVGDVQVAGGCRRRCRWGASGGPRRPGRRRRCRRRRWPGSGRRRPAPTPQPPHTPATVVISPPCTLRTQLFSVSAMYSAPSGPTATSTG